MLAAGLAAFGLLYITQAVLPSIGTTFGVTATTASLTVSFATGALALTIAPISGLAESCGRLRMIRIGLVSALLLAVGCALSVSIWELLACRALMGVALAAVVAVAMGHLGDEVHPAKVSAAMGVRFAGNTLGGVVGRLLPGAALDFGSWRFGLLVFVAFAALATVAFLVLLPRPQRFTPSPAGLRPQLQSARRLLPDPGTRRLCGIAFLLMGGFVGAYNFLTFRLTSAPIHLSESAASRLFLAYLAGTVSSTVAGYCAGRFGRRRVLCTGIVPSLAGLALTLPNNLWCIGAGLVLFTAGFFAAHSTASGWISARASKQPGAGLRPVPDVVLPGLQRARCRGRHRLPRGRLGRHRRDGRRAGARRAAAGRSHGCRPAEHSNTNHWKLCQQPVTRPEPGAAGLTGACTAAARRRSRRGYCGPPPHRRCGTAGTPLPGWC